VQCVLQCVAVCCSVLQCVAVCCSVLQRVLLEHINSAASGLLRMFTFEVVHEHTTHVIFVNGPHLQRAWNFEKRFWMCEFQGHGPLYCNIQPHTLQHTATYCNVLQHTATHVCSFIVNAHKMSFLFMTHTWNAPRSVLQCETVCCNVLQCVVVCHGVVKCVAVCCSVLQCVACVAAC